MSHHIFVTVILNTAIAILQKIPYQQKQFFRIENIVGITHPAQCAHPVKITYRSIIILDTNQIHFLKK